MIKANMKKKNVKKVFIINNNLDKNEKHCKDTKDHEDHTDTKKTSFLQSKLFF